MPGRRCFPGTTCPPADQLEKQSARLAGGGVHELSLRSPELSAPVEIHTAGNEQIPGRAVSSLCSPLAWLLKTLASETPELETNAPISSKGTESKAGAGST